MTYPINNYPTSIQNTTQPISTDDTGLFDHAGLHDFELSSINALKTKVGINGSAVNTTIDYKISGVATGDKAASILGSETLFNKTLSSPTINTPTISSPNITNPSTTGTDSGSETLQNKTLGTGTIITEATPTLGSDATGDIYYRASNGKLARLGIGATNYLLSSTGAAPQWVPISLTKFGGTGSDGALSISSGTTNIDLGGNAIFIRNYTLISITGTANITFSNPHANGTIVMFKSQGTITITSSANPAIDLRLMGAQAFSGTTNGFFEHVSGKTGVNNLVSIYGKSLNLYTASGGSQGYGGAPGKAGGTLYLECGGNLNITSNIDLSGQAGTSGGNFDNQPGGTGGGSWTDGGGGGICTSTGSGGGGGGSFLCIYAGMLVANSGTYNVSGGSGGNCAGGGGNGYSLVVFNTEFV